MHTKLRVVLSEAASFRNSFAQSLGPQNFSARAPEGSKEDLCRLDRENLQDLSGEALGLGPWSGPWRLGPWRLRTSPERLASSQGPSGSHTLAESTGSSPHTGLRLLRGAAL